MEKEYDLAVIGGGPGGYTAAIAGAKRGLKTVLVERERLGGTCLNVGCIPTKYLLDKAALMERIASLTRDGVFRGAGQYSFRRIQAGKAEVVDRLVGGVEYLLRANGVQVVRGEASLGADRVVRCGDEVYRAGHVIIATGAEPVRPPIPGGELALDSTGALALDRVPERLVVIGGGVIGLELASAFNAFGARVTVLEMLPSLLPGEAREPVDRLSALLGGRGLDIRTGCAVSKIERGAGGLTVVTDAGSFAAHQVLVAAGRRARLSGVDTEGLGLTLNRDGSIVTDCNMQTAAGGIYAVGDAAGGDQLAHAAFAEAEVAVAHILGEGRDATRRAVPRCVYTLPPYAAVGITAAGAEAEGIATCTGTFPYTGNGMALAEGAEGCVYVTADRKTGRTLGVQIVGEGAPEMIAAGVQAVESGMTVDGWSSLVVAHPSLGEMLREAAMDCFGLSVHGAVKRETG